jgi:thioredoxin-related protein
MVHNNLARLFLVGLAAAGALCAQETPAWHTRLDDARQAAEQAGRPILAFFTDSVDCPWCAKLKADVLDTPEFRRWAAQHVVLLELDFPTGRPQDPAVKEQNESLKKKLAVRGYPVVVFLSAEEKEVGRIPGYPKGVRTPQEARDRWLSQARTIMSKAFPAP